MQAGWWPRAGDGSFPLPWALALPPIAFEAAAGGLVGTAGGAACIRAERKQRSIVPALMGCELVLLISCGCDEQKAPRQHVASGSKPVSGGCPSGVCFAPMTVIQRHENHSRKRSFDLRVLMCGSAEPRQAKRRPEVAVACSGNRGDILKTEGTNLPGHGSAGAL